MRLNWFKRFFQRCDLCFRRLDKEYEEIVAKGEDEDTGPYEVRSFACSACFKGLRLEEGIKGEPV